MQYMNTVYDFGFCPMPRIPCEERSQINRFKAYEKPFSILLKPNERGLCLTLIRAHAVNALWVKVATFQNTLP